MVRSSTGDAVPITLNGGRGQCEKYGAKKGEGAKLIADRGNGR